MPHDLKDIGQDDPLFVRFPVGYTAPRSGSVFTSISVASLTALQAAGTDPVIAADSSRQVLEIVPPVDCYLSLSSNGASDIPLIGGVVNDFSGVLCPTNALYINGLSTAQRLVVWKA